MLRSMSTDAPSQHATSPGITIRPATRDDAAFLVPLVDTAGEGIPSYMWSRMAAPGQRPAEVGLSRVQGDGAAVSWRNARIAEFDGRPAGCLFAYRQPDAPEPIGADMPRMFVPLQELENEACGTGYVYILATAAAFRGRGVGAALLAAAEDVRGPAGMSVIVSDGNRGARRLYERHGYALAASRPMVKEGWRGHGQAWLLLRKP